jgi:hypothetical protein
MVSGACQFLSRLPGSEQDLFSPPTPPGPHGHPKHNHFNLMESDNGSGTRLA